MSKSTLLAMRSAAAPANEPGTVVVRMATGETYPLTGRLVVGRSPATGPDDVPLAVTDPAVSKTHLAMEPAAGAAWVTDLHSRNGVSLLLPDGDEVPLVPGHATYAPVGSRVLFGGSSATIEGGATPPPPRPPVADARPRPTPPEPEVEAPPRRSTGPLITKVPWT